MGMTRGKCQRLYEDACNATLQRMEWYVRKKEMLHEDVNTVNVLFDGTIGDVELIDWGSWKAKKVRAKLLLSTETDHSLSCGNQRWTQTQKPPSHT
jgi:hypothetical protein